MPVAAAAWVRVPAGRVVFLDLARVTAVLLMVQGHTLHALLAPGLRAGAAFDAWVAVRGFTSPTFLLLSGACFAIATLKRWDDNVRLSLAVVRRVARFVGFVGLGYALHFPVHRFADLSTLPPEGWDAFLQVDILQTIGVSLLLLQGLVLATRTPARFGLACAALAAVLLPATPWFHGIDWHARLPAPLAAYLYRGHGSPFPLVGWAFFPLLGAALGVAYRRLPAVSPASLALGSAVAGTALVSVSFVLVERPAAYCGGDWRPGSCPDFFVWRLVGAALLLAAACYAARGWTRLPRPLQAVAEESLVVYFVHLCVVYGCIWSGGLRQRLGETQTAAAALGWAALVVASMVLLAWVWNGFKRRFPRGTHAARAAIVCAMVALS